jgi:integrase
MNLWSNSSDRAPERLPPTLEEVRALANAMPDKLKLAMVLAYACPVRKGELLGLRRCDTDLPQCTISIQRQLAGVAGRPDLKYRRTKNGETGVVELSPAVMIVVA